jgi:hypothetical protein
MRYPAFRKQGLFVGPGVVEAGCKTVIGARLKRSGMFWSVEGANAIIALRCCQLKLSFRGLLGFPVPTRLTIHIFVAHPASFPLRSAVSLTDGGGVVANKLMLA